MPTQKNIYENLVGSAEWLRMPTRCCKYLKCRLCWSSLFDKLLSWQKKRSSVEILQPIPQVPWYNPPLSLSTLQPKGSLWPFSSKKRVASARYFGGRVVAPIFLPNQRIISNFVRCQLYLPYLDGILSKMTQAYEESTLVP